MNHMGHAFHIGSLRLKNYLCMCLRCSNHCHVTVLLRLSKLWKNVLYAIRGVLCDIPKSVVSITSFFLEMENNCIILCEVCSTL